MRLFIRNNLAFSKQWAVQAGQKTSKRLNGYLNSVNRGSSLACFPSSISRLAISILWLKEYMSFRFLLKGSFRACCSTASTNSTEFLIPRSGFRRVTKSPNVEHANGNLSSWHPSMVRKQLRKMNDICTSSITYICIHNAWDTVSTIRHRKRQKSEMSP